MTTKPRHTGLIVTVVSAMIGGTLVASANFEISFVLLALAAVGIVILLAVSARSDRQQGNLWGAATLVLLHLSFGFGIGGFYYATVTIRDARLVVSATALTHAALLGLAASLLLYIGYIGVGKRAGERLSAQLAKGVRDADQPLSLLFVVVVGWIGRVQLVIAGGYFHITGEYRSGSNAVLLASLSTLPTVVIFVLVAKRWSTGRALGWVWLIVALEVLWCLPSGSRAPIIGIFLGLIVLRTRMGYRLPVAAVVLTVSVSIFFLFPAVVFYRGNDASYSANISRSATQATSATFGRGSEELFRQGFDTTFSRFSDILSSAVVFDDTIVDPKSIGSPLVNYLITSPLPRAVAQEKPNPGIFGNEFGRAYGLTRPDDLATSIAVSQPLHAYMRGGWLAVIFLSLLAGALYRVIENMLTRTPSLPLQATYAAVAFALATSIGTILPQGLLGLVKSLVVTLAVLGVGGALARAFTSKRSIVGTPQLAPQVRG